jgi:type I restriction enzyme R subunit
MAFLSEAEIEHALLAQLRTLGYSIESEEDIGPDGQRPERSPSCHRCWKKTAACTS